MKYNLIVSGANEEVFANLLDSSSGKLIIASDNSFVASAILNDLSKRVKDGANFNLFSGISQINPEHDYETKVIVTNAQDIENLDRSIIDDSYYVAMVTKSNDSVYEFDISLSKISECVTTTSQEVAVNVQANEITEKGVNNDVFKALYSHNVVFILNITQSIIDTVTKWNASSVIIESLDSYSNIFDDIIDSTSDCVVLNFPCPTEYLQEMDCKESIKEGLSYGIRIVCDTSWIKLFLELSDDMDVVDFTSTVIYNDRVIGACNNETLFSDYATQQ